MYYRFHRNCSDFEHRQTHWEDKDHRYRGKVLCVMSSCVEVPESLKWYYQLSMPHSGLVNKTWQSEGQKSFTRVLWLLKVVPMIDSHLLYNCVLYSNESPEFNVQSHFICSLPKNVFKHAHCLLAVTTVYKILQAPQYLLIWPYPVNLLWLHHWKANRDGKLTRKNYCGNIHHEKLN